MFGLYFLSPIVFPMGKLTVVAAYFKDVVQRQPHLYQCSARLVQSTLLVVQSVVQRQKISCSRLELSYGSRLEAKHLDQRFASHGLAYGISYSCSQLVSIICCKQGRAVAVFIRACTQQHAGCTAGGDEIYYFLVHSIYYHMEVFLTRTRLESFVLNHLLYVLAYSIHKAEFLFSDSLQDVFLSLNIDLTVYLYVRNVFKCFFLRCHTD